MYCLSKIKDVTVHFPLKTKLHHPVSKSFHTFPSSITSDSEHQRCHLCDGAPDTVIFP